MAGMDWGKLGHQDALRPGPGLGRTRFGAPGSTLGYTGIHGDHIEGYWEHDEGNWVLLGFTGCD